MLPAPQDDGGENDPEMGDADDEDDDDDQADEDYEDDGDDVEDDLFYPPLSPIERSAWLQ